MLSSQTRTNVLIGFSYVMFYMINVNLVCSSVLNSVPENSTNFNRDPQRVLNASPQKTPSDLRRVIFNCTKYLHPSAQPVYSKHSQIQKCCPFGEILQESNDGNFRCVPGNGKSDIDNIYTIFYGDSKCAIEKQDNLQFSYVPNKSCFRNNLTYERSEKLKTEFYAIQNGSLLVITEKGRSKTVFDFYCVDLDSDGKLLAKVCDKVEPTVSKSAVVLVYVGLVIASIALVMACLAYMFVPKLNDVFGYLLVGHAGTFMVGMILISLEVCGERYIDQGVQEMVEITANVFMITSVFAFLLMNIHNYVYAICYHRYDLELHIKNERKKLIFCSVFFTATIILLCQQRKNILMFHVILYSYYAAITIVLCLSHSLLRKMVNSLQFIRFSVSRGLSEMVVNNQARIYGERLTVIKFLNRLCQVEAVCTLIFWLAFSSLQLHPNKQDDDDDSYRIAAALVVILQGMLIGLIFLMRGTIKTTVRNVWIGLNEVQLDEDSELEKL